MTSILKKVVGAGVILTILTSTSANVLANDSTNYYESTIKAPELGNYQFRVETHEVPSHEWIPIISKDYFPKTVGTFITEVDNTNPSAVYRAKAISKVDVVFAFGDMEQSKTMENYIPTFESKLNVAGNNIDAYVEKVETSTIDVTNQDPSTLLSTWESWKQFPGDPTTTWSYIQDDRSIQDNEYHCHRQGYVDRKNDTHGDFILSADIVGYNHRYNDFYGLTFRHNTNGEHYAVVYQDVSGSRCGMYTGQLTTGISLVKATGHGIGTAVKTYTCLPWAVGDYWNLKIEMKGNDIIVYLDDKVIIQYTDHDPYVEGNYGVVAVSHGSGRFKNIQLTKGSKKSLGEAISDVTWRDNSLRFVVYGEDTLPDYMQNTDNADYQYTVAKLLNSNAYLIGLGTSINKDSLTGLINNISMGHEAEKGTFIKNKPLVPALNSSCNWIIDLARKYMKPTDYLLVNTPIAWETEYKDAERDLPLNFGEHDGTKNSDTSDKTLSSLWGVGLTHLYNQDKILAEKWRYKHINTFYDNSPIVESFSEVWIQDPVEIFPNPGLYRVNYKRRDNPFYTDVILSNPFNSYRYWSTDYDMNGGR